MQQSGAQAICGCSRSVHASRVIGCHGKTAPAAQSSGTRYRCAQAVLRFVVGDANYLSVKQVALNRAAYLHVIGARLGQEDVLHDVQRPRQVRPQQLRPHTIYMGQQPIYMGLQPRTFV